jgi:hypothetical protein
MKELHFINGNYIDVVLEVVTRVELDLILLIQEFVLQNYVFIVILMNGGYFANVVKNDQQLISV